MCDKDENALIKKKETIYNILLSNNWLIIIKIIKLFDWSADVV